MDDHHAPVKLAKVTAIYRWFDGAHFDADYYRNAHARMTWALLQPLGLLRFESDCTVDAAAAASAIVAASNAYFASLAEAQAAVAAAGAELAADVPRYTNIRPELRLSEAWISESQ